MNFEIIETERLRLRKLTPEGHQFVFRNYSVPDIKQFFGIHRDEDFKMETLRFEKGMTTYNRSFVLFHLLDKKNDTVLGACGFHNWLAEHRRAEIGYALIDDLYKRKGYMSEAILPIVAYGFNEMNLNRMEAFVSPDNEASQRVVKKLGFQQEGHLKQHFFKNNIYHDSIVFGLLRNEYIDTTR